MHEAPNALCSSCLVNVLPSISADGHGVADYPETWDEPSANFEAFVADTVRYRVGKYTQPDHPARITHEAAKAIFGKVSDTTRRAYMS